MQKVGVSEKTTSARARSDTSHQDFLKSHQCNALDPTQPASTSDFLQKKWAFLDRLVARGRNCLDSSLWIPCADTAASGMAIAERGVIVLSAIVMCVFCCLFLLLYLHVLSVIEIEDWQMLATCIPLVYPLKFR